MNYDDDDRNFDQVTRREVRREQYTTNRDYVERSSTGTTVAIVLIVVLALLAILYWAFRDQPQSFAVPGQPVGPSTVIVQQPVPDPVVVPTVPAPAPVLTPSPSLPDSASYEARRAADEAREAARAAERRAREAKEARDAANAAKDATAPVDAPLIPRERKHIDNSQDSLPETTANSDSSSTSTTTN